MIYKLAEHKNEYLHLPILPSIQEQAWKQSQHHSHTIARHNSYINYLSLYTLIDWFRNEQSLAEPVIYPSAKSLSSIWEVVNGAGIKLGERQIVIIPCEISEFEEFSVPQEWVDIPEWVGDYYLAIQVNLEPEEDECWIEVCGFTTHSYLKNLGKYNFHDRTYAITVDNLIQDITVMEITLPLKMKAEIPELPHLSAVKAEELLQMFANSSIYSPRLRVNDITFEEWAALLVNDSWRQKLYEQRMGKLVTLSIILDNKMDREATYRKIITAIIDIDRMPTLLLKTKSILLLIIMLYIEIFTKDSIVAWIKNTLSRSKMLYNIECIKIPWYLLGNKDK